VKIKIWKFLLSMLPPEAIAMVNICYKHQLNDLILKKLDIASWGNIDKINFEILMIFLLITYLIKKGQSIFLRNINF
jgi:hypothetical protein